MKSMALIWDNPIHKPCFLFLIGLLITIVYIPGIVGATIPTGWLFLFVVAPILLVFSKIEFGFGFLFICYASLSLIWTKSFSEGLYYLAQIVALSCVFCFGRILNDLKLIFIGLSFGLMINGFIALSQYYLNFKEIFVTNSTVMVAGLFVNPNIYSEVSVIILIGLVIYKLWWWIPVTLPGILIVHSRASILAFGIIIFSLIWKINRRAAIISTLVISFIALVFYWNSFQISSVQERLNLWADTIQGFKFLGNGVGSFEILYSFYSTRIDISLFRPKYAHNDIIQLIFEFGIGTLLLIPLLKLIDKDERYILYAIGIISLFTYPFHVPVIAFIGCLVAGYLNSSHGSFWNIRFNWRPTLFKRA